MTGKAVLITGANGGIGSALVEAFANAGWRVVATSRPGDAPGGAHAFIPADLAALAQDEAALADFAKEVRAGAEAAALACLVNNAALQALAPLGALAHADIVRTMQVNLLAPMMLAKVLLPDLQRTKGSILNIGSVHAQATKPEFSAYAASKAGLHGLTRALAVDLGPDVRVNTLAPAATETPMLKAGFEGRADAFKALEACHPAGRIASPAEIANIAVWLASDAAAFITGATLYADGGVLSRLHDPA